MVLYNTTLNNFHTNSTSKSNKYLCAMDCARCCEYSQKQGSLTTVINTKDISHQAGCSGVPTPFHHSPYFTFRCKHSASSFPGALQDSHFVISISLNSSFHFTCGKCTSRQPRFYFKAIGKSQNPHFHWAETFQYA